MNRHNAKINAFDVQRLELKDSDRVLEVGFGGGVALRSLVANAAFVGGVDPSREMVKWAKAKHSSAVTTGRADFRQGTVEAIPFENGSFDKACTVNSVYFWPSLEKGFTEIHRVLAPGGRLVVGILPKQWMDEMGFPTDIFTSRTPDEVISALTAAGFKEVSVERPSPTTRWIAIIAMHQEQAQATAA
jgi:ubiquinone/menaquinone biosynthesis C-methylase UbiE